MAQLEIHIPENWPSEQQEEAGSGTLFTWLLRGDDGKLMRSGQSALDAMPAAAQCHIIVPASRVLLSSVQLPAQNRKKFMQALPYAVEDRIMADPESVHVAMGPVQENGAMPVAIVDRSWLRHTLEILQQAGFTPSQAAIETLLAPWHEKSWTVVWRGNGGFLRDGPYSGISLDGGNLHEPPPGLRLALEEETGNQPGSIQVSCIDAAALDAAAWSGNLGIPVSLVDEWKWPAPGQNGINLLQGEFALKSANQDWLPRLRPAIAMIGVLIALQIAFSLLDWAMLKYEKYQLTASMEQSFRKAFPDAKVIVDAPLQMSRNLADLRHAAGQTDPNDFLPLLAKIGPLLGKESKLDKLEYQQGNLNISLTLPDNNAAEALRARLAAMPQVRQQTGNAGPGGLETQLTIGAQK